MDFSSIGKGIKDFFGSDTAKSIYECLNLIIANRAGGLEKFGYSTKNFLLSFHPWGEEGPSMSMLIQLVLRVLIVRKG